MKQSRYPKTISGIIFIGILLFQSLPKYVEAQEIKVDRIDGYGGFKFGMTLEEAIQVRNDDYVVNDHDYDLKWPIIKREASIYGYKALIIVQFNNQTKLLHQIVIQFDQWGQVLNVL